MLKIHVIIDCNKVEYTGITSFVVNYVIILHLIMDPLVLSGQYLVCAFTI